MTVTISRPGLRLTLLTALIWAALISAATAQQPGVPLPSGSETSDQKHGSVLIFSYFTSSASSPGSANTRFSLTNTNPAETAFVHLFFVDGSNGSVMNFDACLSAGQTFYFLATDIDPGVTGYLLAVATDQTGCPVGFNYLTGQAAVKTASGHRGSFNAEAVAALFTGRLPTWTTGAPTAALTFDGNVYNRLPRALSLDTIRSPGNNNRTLLILTRIGGNLSSGSVPAIGAVSGQLYDTSGSGHDFSFTHNRLQLAGELTDAFPVVTPALSAVIPAGSTGWMTLSAEADAGLLGLMINLNQNAATSASAFNGGHPLHKLTLAASESVTIPVSSPGC